MKVAGFTIIRNAEKYDYPIVEAITSILPICDDFFVLVGNSTDRTLELIQSIPSNKIKIFHSTWNDALKEGGKVLADETNKCFDLIDSSYDWCFYIQGDEIVHEKYLPTILQEMSASRDDQSIEGLLLKYLHFYGSYDYIGDSKQWYRREIRVIRNNKEIRSYKDAQGFRINNRKLNVKLIDAYVYHYGWVRPPAIMKEKDINFNKMYHTDEWIQRVKKPEIPTFDYSEIDSLQHFQGTHPEVMIPRIKRMNWSFSFDPTTKKGNLKTRITRWVEHHTGWRMFEYRNYHLIKKSTNA